MQVPSAGVGMELPAVNLKVAARPGRAGVQEPGERSRSRKVQSPREEAVDTERDTWGQRPTGPPLPDRPRLARGPDSPDLRTSCPPTAGQGLLSS